MVFVPFLLMSSVAAAKTQRLVVWHNQDKEQARIFQQMINEFEATEKVRVILETGMDLSTSLLVQRQSGNYPDVVLAPSDLVGLHEQLNLSTIPSAIIPSAMDPLAIETVKLGSTVWGLPMLSGNHPLFFYNKR